MRAWGPLRLIEKDQTDRGHDWTLLGARFTNAQENYWSGYGLRRGDWGTIWLEEGPTNGMHRPLWPGCGADSWVIVHGDSIIPCKKSKTIDFLRKIIDFLKCMYCFPKEINGFNFFRSEFEGYWLTQIYLSREFKIFRQQNEATLIIKTPQKKLSVVL